MPKTWLEKYNTNKPFQVKTIDKKFADLPEGCVMLIPTPKIIANYIAQIPFGVEVDIKRMRLDLASSFEAENSCPVTTSIFLRVVSEVTHQEVQKGKKIEEVIPFWRVVNTKLPIAKKLACGIEFIKTQRNLEGLQ